MEIELIEKDNLIKRVKKKNDNLNEKIKEIEIIINDKTNYIFQLKKEIKLFRDYNNFSSKEKLITIKLISVDQDIDLPIITKNTEAFSKIEKILYNKYPKYKNSENYFIVNGNQINRNMTLEENKIRNDDSIMIGIINFDWL